MRKMAPTDLCNTTDSALKGVGLFLKGLAAALAVILAASPAVASMEALERALDGQLQHHPAETLGFEWQGLSTGEINRDLVTVYHEYALRPLWVKEKGPGEKAQAIYGALRSAAVEGLNPDDYLVGGIEALWANRSPEELAKLDILLTLGLTAYVNDTHAGRVQPRESDPTLFDSAGVKRLEAMTIVGQALEAPDLALFLAGQPPGHGRYGDLREALKRYREIEAAGGWPEVPEGKTLHPGEKDQRVPVIRRRLAASGDLEDGDGTPDLYDETLVEAVKGFQRRHGLAVDGVIGKGTLAAMNVPVQRRVRQIEMNMERWRWKDHDLGPSYALVDIAGFDLQAVSEGKIVLEMPVIVGKLHHETPVFSDRIKYIEFNPFWNITPHIARSEMLRKIQKDPGYLASKHIRLFSGWGENPEELDPRAVDWNRVGKGIVRYKLRQDPGPWNALGTMKFMFPNPYDVYLHDTPNHNLFDLPGRAFSHGCVRLSDPAAMAGFLLGGEGKGWGPERIDGVVTGGKRTIVRLEEAMPVHIAYETAWVDMEGAVHFSGDLYGRDGNLEKALYGE